MLAHWKKCSYEHYDKLSQEM